MTLHITDYRLPTRHMTLTLARLGRDMQDQRGGRLVLPEDQISFCLSNLMLTGVATPYCHNGLLEVHTTADQQFDVSSTDYRKYFCRTIFFAAVWRGQARNRGAE